MFNKKILLRFFISFITPLHLKPFFSLTCFLVGTTVSFLDARRCRHSFLARFAPLDLLRVFRSSNPELAAFIRHMWCLHYASTQTTSIFHHKKGGQWLQSLSDVSNGLISLILCLLIFSFNLFFLKSRIHNLDSDTSIDEWQRGS